MDMTSSPIAEPCADEGTQAWYCLRTHLKHEHIAAAHLKPIRGVEVFNPQLRLLRSTRNGRRWFVESLFPNYVFARFVLERLWEKVAYTPGVKAVLRFGARAPEIPEAVIEDLRRNLAGMSSQVLTDAPAEGQEVEIAGGAFAGMKASVLRVLPGRQRAQILVEVMGRLVPAELSLNLVLFNRREAAQFALPRLEPAFADRSRLAISP
jgi:transcriptional antiterminator RfaH